MAGEVKVLLVSSGDSPEALVAELGRLKVLVTECSFGEAEEQLETGQQDLVALIGARGAIELANMIDDLPGAPKMVIVAERRELAKLRGLNREVVVSLFAMETTEKVVGQRIESLARRAHRRTEQQEAPAAPAVKKTSLGLPSAAAAVGKVNLKKPPGAARPPITESVPPSSGNHPGAEPATPEPAKVAPPRAAPPRPQTAVEAPATEELDEDELLESILPDAPEAPEADEEPGLVTENIPMMSLGPDEESESPEPPASPPAVGPPTDDGPAPKKDLSLKIDPGELDLTSAESALENLDSVKLDLTEDIVQHAKEIQQSVAETDAEDGVDQELDVEDLESLRPDEDLEAPQDKSPGVGFDQTIALGSAEPPEDLKRTLEAASSSGDVEEASSVSADEKAPRGPEPRVESAKDQSPPVARRAAAVTAEPSVAPAASAKKSGIGGPVVIAALILASGAAGAAYKAGVFGTSSGGAETTQASSKDESPAPTESDKEDIPKSAVAGQKKTEPAQSEPKKSESPPEETPAPQAAEEPPKKPEESEKEDGRPAITSSSSMDNPFRMVDTNKPSCDAILAGNAPVAGQDPVNEASQFWAQARKAIVAGKDDDAQRLMCSAVALFSESAAVEGLAHHYLNVGSYREALKWVDAADKVRPNQLEMGNLRGDIHGMMGDVAKAREVWLSTLHIEDVPAQSSRISAVSKDYSVEAGRHLRRGDFVRAELFFRRAIILDPKNLNGIIGLAKTYHRLEKPDYTRAFCEMSLEVSDVIPEVHVLLGDLAQAEGKKDEARSRYERALAVRPGFFPAKRGLNEVK